jgi:hypothetical protein
MSSNNNSSSGGIGFCGLLTIVFIILKLCGVIAWSWWWVLSPIWISAILVVVILIVWFAIITHEDKPKKRGTGKWKF